MTALAPVDLRDARIAELEQRVADLEAFVDAHLDGISDWYAVAHGIPVRATAPGGEASA